MRTPIRLAPCLLLALAAACGRGTAVTDLDGESAGEVAAAVIAGTVNATEAEGSLATREPRPLLERHARFARKVNVGFMQVLARDRIALRVFERDAGETLACGTGACAAVVAGIRLGWLDAAVEVQTRGGLLRIEWAGDSQPVLMTGPATKVFDGDIEL